MLSLFSISCSDDDSNNNGFYQVIEHTKQSDSCSGDFIDVENDFEFFKIKEQSFFGMPVETLYECETNDESSCDMEYGSWLAESSWSSGYDGTCSVGKTEYDISSDSDGVTITKTTRSATLTLKSGEECDTDLADKYDSDLECETIEITRADRL
jgi:hypothetical protein